MLRKFQAAMLSLEASVRHHSQLLCNQLEPQISVCAAFDHYLGPASQPGLLPRLHGQCVNGLQPQSSLDEEASSYPEHLSTATDRTFTRADSASSNLPPGKDAAAGFKGAFKKVANGIAGKSHACPLHCCHEMSQQRNCGHNVAY